MFWEVTINNSQITCLGLQTVSMVSHWIGCRATQHANTTIFQERKLSGYFHEYNQKYKFLLARSFCSVVQCSKISFWWVHVGWIIPKVLQSSHQQGSKVNNIGQLQFGGIASNPAKSTGILPLSLHDVHFVRLINAENLFSLRARDMAIIFTRHTT